MTDLTAERRESGKLTLKYLSDGVNRARLRKVGIEASTPIVVCEWTTPVSEVLGMLRLQDGSSKVLVSIRRESAIFTLTASADVPDGLDSLSLRDMHRDSEIGMVYDALKPKPFLTKTPVASSARQLGQYMLTAA